MAKNLIELIKASGGAGASGQTFRLDVVGAATGIKMTDYLVTAWSWTGFPDAPSAFTIYPSGQAFALVATMTRGSQASLIQRLTSAAFTAALTAQAAATGHSVVINSVSQTGTGGVFTVNVTVTSANTGSMSGSVLDNNAGVAPGSGVAWIWTLGLNQSGVSGETDFWLDVTYDPDTATFNPALTNYTFNSNLNGWPLRLTNRGYTTAELTYRWWDNATDAANQTVGTIVSTATQLEFTTYVVADNRDRWVRWRYGAGAWSAAIAVSTAETRII